MQLMRHTIADSPWGYCKVVTGDLNEKVRSKPNSGELYHNRIKGLQQNLG